MKKGSKHSAVARAKISAAAKKRPPVSPETRARISEVQKGRIVSPETRAKISAVKTGCKRAPFSPEHLARMSAAQKSKCRSPETRVRMSAAKKGRIFSPEHRAKISVSHVRRIQEGRIHIKSRGKQGYFYSKKNKKKLHYRSLLELSWYKIFEADRQVEKYCVEPIALPYLWEGSVHHYLPDLRVRYKNNQTTEIIEVKPEAQWSDPLNLVKWDAATEWCKNKSIRFRVVGYNG